MCGEAPLDAAQPWERPVAVPATEGPHVEEQHAAREIRDPQRLVIDPFFGLAVRELGQGTRFGARLTRACRKSQASAEQRDGSQEAASFNGGGKRLALGAAWTGGVHPSTLR